MERIKNVEIVLRIANVEIVLKIANLQIAERIANLEIVERISNVEIVERMYRAMLKTYLFVKNCVTVPFHFISIGVYPCILHKQ